MPNTLGVIGALIATAIGLSQIVRRRKLLKINYKTEGEVVELHQSGDDIMVTIRFTTIGGEVVIKKYHFGQSADSKIGDKKIIYYNPNEPTKFMIDSPVEKWVPLIFLIFGTIMLVLLYTVFRNSNSVSF